MDVKRLSRRVTVVALAAVAVAAIVLPAFGVDEEEAVRLHISGGVATFGYGTSVQTITTARNGCQITSAETIVDLTALGAGGVQPGFASDSIGVKSSGSNANGTPCGQVDQVETLQISPAAGGVIAGRNFSKVRLDLEMTGNAVVLVTVSGATQNQVYTLQTGNSIDPLQTQETGYDLAVPYEVFSGPGDEVDACAAPNSSGPNNAANDNCLWEIDPGFDFNRVSVTTSIGTASLEGGSDHAANPDFDSLFYLANSAPNAVDDSFTTDEDTPLTGNVLANDLDADGNTLEATLGTGPTNGTLSLSSNGDFTYTPAADYNGSDSFTYTVSDGAGGSDTATVSIGVTPVNDPPVAVNGTESTEEDTPKVITVGTDIDSEVIDAECTTDSGGTYVDNGDGTVTYSPAPDFNGDEVLTCTITDAEGASAEVQSVITVGVDPVNDAPVATDDTAETDQDVPEFVQPSVTVAIDVLDNDTDVDGDPLEVTNLSDPANGSVVVNPDGTVAYTPDPGFTGSDTFTYTAFDGAATSNPATVTVTVFPVICSGDTVSVTDGEASGTFTRLTDPEQCKRYTISASETDEEVVFQPEGGTLVFYRGVIELGPDPAPLDGVAEVGLEYDPDGPDGPDGYQPLLWCEEPVFNGAGEVTGAGIPSGETWCLASAFTRGVAGDQLLTTYQVYGEDDPGFSKPG